MLSKGDAVKIETPGGETYYGTVVHLGEDGKHIGVCRHDEEDIKKQFMENPSFMSLEDLWRTPNDSLEQPSPLVEVPSTSSGDTIDTQSLSPLK